MRHGFGKKALDSPTLQLVLKPGTRLQNGKYLLIEPYGQGPFTICYLAQQALLGRKVIINEFFLLEHDHRDEGGLVVNRDLDPALYQTFKQDWFGEAVTLSNCVENEHFVKVLDTFEENGTVYYVTDYVSETDLRSYTLAQVNGRLTEDAALEMIRQIIRGLTLLHTHGIYHLNLSPVKVLINNKGQAVIFSVGIARRKIPAGILGDPCTLARPGYTSPELYEPNCDYGPWTDLYSVGAILYFMLTGQDPLPAPDRKHTRLAEPKMRVPAISARTNDAVMKALTPDPAGRFSLLNEFLEALPNTPSVNSRQRFSRKMMVPLLVSAFVILGLAAGWYFLREPATLSTARQDDSHPGQPLTAQSPPARSQWSVNQDIQRGMTLVKDPGAGDSLFLGRYYALLIGIAAYKDKRYETLSEPYHDVQAMREVLVGQYTFREKDVRVLTDPDKKAVFRALNYYRDSVGPHDNLFVFYAGHGRFDEKSNTGYILPSDADFSNDADWISFVEIRKKFEVIPARHILLIADACYAGSVFRGAGPEAGAATDQLTLGQLSRRSRTAFTSAYLKPVPDRSDFIRQLLSNLQTNQQPLFLSEDLYINTRNSLMRSTSKKDPVKWGVLQDCGDEGGDFIFIRKDKTQEINKK